MEYLATKWNIVVILFLMLVNCSLINAQTYQTVNTYIEKCKENKIDFRFPSSSIELHEDEYWSFANPNLPNQSIFITGVQIEYDGNLLFSYQMYKPWNVDSGYPTHSGPTYKHPFNGTLNYLRHQYGLPPYFGESERGLPKDARKYTKILYNQNLLNKCGADSILIIEFPKPDQIHIMFEENTKLATRHCYCIEICKKGIQGGISFLCFLKTREELMNVTQYICDNITLVSR